MVTQFFEEEVSLETLLTETAVGTLADDELTENELSEAAEEWFRDHLETLTPVRSWLPSDDPADTLVAACERYDKLGFEYQHLGVRVTIKEK